MHETTNGWKYIDAVVDMYALKKDKREELENEADVYNNALKKYEWNDIQSAINHFFVRMSDKTRPRLSQILAILESWRDTGKIQVFEPEPEPDDKPNPFARPTTKIWSIKDAFDKMIDIFIDGGVIPDDKGNVKNIRSIIDPITDLPVLNPIMWFGWKLEAVKQTRPDLFARFPNATNLEQLAIALQNKLIPFKVRDWARLAEQARQRNGGVMPRGDINVGFGTVGE